MLVFKLSSSMFIFVSTISTPSLYFNHMIYKNLLDVDLCRLFAAKSDS